MWKLPAAFFLMGTLWITGCKTEPQLRNFDLQGHRGCRGLLPENTIPGFLKALDLGVNTLEMDVVISRDGNVVLSHEPFLSHEICFGPDGDTITVSNEQGFNLFEMDYDTIAQCDCGSKPHPRFPNQQKMEVHKPLLSEVIDAVEKYATENGMDPPNYNIETKTTESTDGVFHPGPEEFVVELMRVLYEKDVATRCVLQSFDVRTLRQMQSSDRIAGLALLVEANESIDDKIKALGFNPDILSPDFSLVTAELIAEMDAAKIAVIPWTVNDPADMQRMISLRVAGLITDYPDRFDRKWLAD